MSTDREWLVEYLPMIWVICLRIDMVDLGHGDSRGKV